MFINPMRKALILALFLSSTFAAGQSSSPRLEPPEELPEKVPPIISFTLSFPESSPPFYNIAIESSGRAEYKSTPKPNNIGDPYLLKFVASEPTCTRLFDLARQVHFFQGNFDYTKSRVAYTGTKTLVFKNAKEEHETSYNWSANPQIQEITTLFENIEDTIELGRQLENKYRYDKLGVDAVLKTLEQEAKGNHLGEIQAIQPILTRIAKDPGMMNISRRRAEFLLTKIPTGVAIAAGTGNQ